SVEDQRKRTLVITSTGPGEGKTLVASNLAAGLALAGQSVVLVDADMRRPRVHTVFEHEREPGLSNVIAGEPPLAQATNSSTVPGLKLLPAGRTPANPAELLSSPRFRDLLDQLAHDFDWVVLDSPPVMAVTDAALLAHAATAVMFVVGAELVDVPNA